MDTHYRINRPDRHCHGSRLCTKQKIQKKIESGELQAAPEIVEADAECCGQHEICEKESLLAAVSKR